MAIVTLAGWKTYRGYAGTDYDTVVESLITSAQAEMERYCSRVFDEATYTDEPIDGRGTAHIYTRNWPIVTLTSIKLRADNSTTETVPSTGYRAVTGVRSDGRITRMPDTRWSELTTTGGGWPSRSGQGAAWPIGTENILVTYTAGYGGTISVPADLAEAAYVLIDHKLEQRGISLDVQTQAMGSQNVTYRTAAERMARFEQLLGPYKRITV